MTRVKVIMDKHAIKDVFETKFARCQEGGAVNGEVCEALPSNTDGKEEALKGRFKGSMKVRE